MRFASVAIVAASLFAVVPQQVSGGMFLLNKANWDTLPEPARAAYAMGLWDGIMSMKDMPEIVGFHAYLIELDACVTGLGLVSKHFADAINKEYEILENWARPPTSMLISGMHKVCLPNINAARAERGEPPLPPM